MKFSSFTKRYHATSFAAMSRPCASSGVLMASWFLNSILLNGRVRFCGFSSLYTKSVPISLLCFKSSGLNSISCVCSHSTSAPSFGMLLRHFLFAKMKSPATPFSKLALWTNLPFSKLHLHSKSPEMPTKFCVKFEFGVTPFCPQERERERNFEVRLANLFANPLQKAS